MNTYMLMNKNEFIMNLISDCGFGEWFESFMASTGVTKADDLTRYMAFQKRFISMLLNHYNLNSEIVVRGWAIVDSE